MRDGGVATWHLLIGGINGMPLGFPAAFQFPWVFGFFSKKLFFFFTSDFSLLFCFCYHSDLLPVILTLLQRQISLATHFSGLDCSFFQGTLFLRFLSLFSSRTLYKFLILSFTFAVFGFGSF